MNLFSWSIPFLGEKISEILYHFIKPNEKYDSEELPLDLLDARKMVEKLLESQKNTVSENLELVKLDGNCPDQRLL